MYGPQTEACDAIHAEKYRGVGENFREAMNRIAASLQDDHTHYMEFRELLLDMAFIPAGRIQAAMGSLKVTTPFNCFVSGTIHDSFTDGPNSDEDLLIDHKSISIMQAATNAAITMRQGGGIGYDFSTLRPKGDIIKGVHAVTDGPLAFANIFDAVCKATSSAGNRRGAQMLVLRVDHPDIEAFIRAKQTSEDVPYEYRPLRGFNMSIAITDKFMECVYSGKPFPLKFNGITYREVDAGNLWEMIMRATYDWAEPGVIFIDTVNKMNNLYYCETIAATNPCGEQTLPPHGACLLGSFNLVKYLTKHISGYTFDYDKFKKDIPTVIRAMDNVTDRARYPLNEQKKDAMNKRRIGIGVMGLANTIEACGYPYGSPEFLNMEMKILHCLNRVCYLASVGLAVEKKPFPYYDMNLYPNGEFIKSLDDDVQEQIKKYGIRNSHLTSIAPTGTISFTADNVSSGIEPVLAYSQLRRIISSNGETLVNVEDYGVHFLGVQGKRVIEVTSREHVDVLCAAQKYVDSAISKTCNVPTDIKWEDFKDIYLRSYENGAKGCTTYRPNGNYDDVIKSVDEIACSIDPVTNQRVGNCAND